MSNRSDIRQKVKPNEYKHARFYSLMAVAYSCAQDIQAGDEVVSQFLHYAMEGYREFHFDTSKSVKVEEIEMKPWKQIDMPCDMVDWVKVGFKSGDFLKVFTNDPRIPKSFNLLNGVPQDNSIPTLAELPTAESVSFYSNGTFSSEGDSIPQLYGNQCNYNYLGYFDCDWDTRVINFKKTITGHPKVYIEFITDGINYDGTTIVHPYAFKCIKLYVHWQRKENDSRVPLGEKQRAQYLYEKKFDETIIRQLDLSIDDIKEALASGIQQTPKLP